MLGGRFLEALPRNVAIVLRGGRRIGAEAANASATVVFRSDAAGAAVLEIPSLLAFAEAFVAGDVDIEGDLVVALEAAYALDALAGGGTPTPASRPAIQDAVQFHYDVSNDFFALF